MEYLYLLVNLGAILIPFIFSFHPKIRFDREWKYLWPALLFSCFIFIPWDMAFTGQGVWGFNDKYLTGIYFLNLPLEEILFFVCIPYSCVFTYYCISTLFDEAWFSKNENRISLFLVLALIFTGIFFINKIYTAITFLSLAGIILLLKYIFKIQWIAKFYLSYFILLIPFFIVNGVLTGIATAEPVVWYNPNEIIGYRLFTIPVEDVFYGMLLIILNVFLFDFQKNPANYFPHQK